MRDLTKKQFEKRLELNRIEPTQHYQNHYSLGIGDPLEFKSGVNRRRQLRFLIKEKRKRVEHMEAKRQVAERKIKNDN